MKNTVRILSLVALGLTSLSLNAADVTVTADITTDTVWTADNEYILGKPIFVKEGATLTIEPGTHIYGFEDTQAGTFGSLVITRGSMIMAEGTASDPIVFTALAERDGIDDGNGGTRDLTLEDSGLWGGLIILGRAILNTPDNPIINPGSPVVGTFDVEGFPAGSSDDITYGGDDDADNSGVVRYVSIRFGGYEFAEDEEINGLTLGAVGSGTTIEFVEVFNNQDDGVEFFGGTVNTRYMVMAFNEDESFDWDQGYRGNNQFWFVVQKSVGEGSNYTLEMDGGDGDVKTLEPFAIPQVYNLTAIGSGADSDNPQTNAALRMKDNTGGFFHNSIFTDMLDYVIRIDDTNTENQQAAGNLGTAGVIWGAFGASDGSVASLTRSGTAAELAVVNGINNSNTIADPMLGGISRMADGGLDPLPMAGSPAFDAPFSAPVSDFFVATPYKGAFGSVNWALGWTKLAQDGYFTAAPADILTDEFGFVYSPSGDLTAEQYVWSYLLSSWIYLGAESVGGWWTFIAR
jgi:hypothetical protein